MSVLIYWVVNVKEDNGERRTTNLSSVSAVILELFKNRLKMVSMHFLNKHLLSNEVDDLVFCCSYCAV